METTKSFGPLMQLDLNFIQYTSSKEALEIRNIPLPEWEQNHKE